MIAAVAILSGGPLAAQAPDRVGPDRARPTGQYSTAATAARDSIRALGLQTELVTKASRDSIRSLDLQTEFPRKNSEPLHLSLPQWLLWVALAAVAALSLYAMRDEILNLLRRRESGWEPPVPLTGEAAAGRDADADVLAAADRMSRDGNFVEAMHALLLHSLAEIRRQLGVHFADSLTSREILRVARLSATGRTSLREIVTAVEWSYFGAYPAAAADYAACRRHFETLQYALRGGAAA
jgi:hypothetical protein